MIEESINCDSKKNCHSSSVNSLIPKLDNAIWIEKVELKESSNGVRYCICSVMPDMDILSCLVELKAFEELEGSDPAPGRIYIESCHGKMCLFQGKR